MFPSGSHFSGFPLLLLVLADCFTNEGPSAKEAIQFTDDVMSSAPFSVDPQGKWLIYRSRESIQPPKLVLFHLETSTRSDVAFSDGSWRHFQGDWLSCVVWDVTDGTVILVADSGPGFRSNLQTTNPVWELVPSSLGCETTHLPISIRQPTPNRVLILNRTTESKILSDHQAGKGETINLNLDQAASSPAGRIVYTTTRQYGSLAKSPEIWLLDLPYTQGPRYLGKHLYGRPSWISETTFLGIGRTRSGRAAIYRWTIPWLIKGE